MSIGLNDTLGSKALKFTKSDAVAGTFRTAPELVKYLTDLHFLFLLALL